MSPHSEPTQGYLALRTQSICSMLTSVLDPQEIPLLAAERKVSAVGLADPNLLGAQAFSRAAFALGVQPIHGLSVLVRGGCTQLTLFARNEQGFENLMALTQRFDHRMLHPRISLDELAGRKEGLIALSSQGRYTLRAFSHALRQWCDYQRHLQDIFGDDFFLTAKEKPPEVPVIEKAMSALQDTLGDAEAGLPGWANLEGLATGFGIPLVAAPLVASAVGPVLVHEGWQVDSMHPHALREEEDPHDQGAVWPTGVEWATNYNPAALEAIQHFAQRIEPFDVDAMIHKAATWVPPASSPRPRARHRIRVESPPPTLRDRVEDGWRSRSTSLPRARHKAYRTRLEHELSLLEAHPDWSEFLGVQAQAVNKLLSSGHRLGPGIGAIGASLSAWCLGLHDIDPVAHDLPFTQWFHPTARPSAQPTGCYLHLGLKEGPSQVRSLGGVLSNNLHTRLMVKKETPYAPFSAMTRPTRRWIRHFPALVDDAGDTDGPFVQSVVIEPSSLQPAYPTLPPMPDACGNFPMLWTEGIPQEVGLKTVQLYHEPAVDTLQTLLARAEARGMDTSGRWRLDQSEVFRRIQHIRCPELRGLHSREGRAVLRRIQPTSFEDLVCAMAFTEQPQSSNLEAFLMANAAPRSRSENHPGWVAPILACSRGVICFREQLLALGERVGLTSEEAWLLSRSIRTFDHQYLESWRARFQEAAAGKGLNGSEMLWEEMQFFGGGSVNRSHAIGRALLIFQIAWLRIQLEGKTR